ncbi:folylpolyglutamate synthase, mitochondrial isoform X1 [Chiloscyllium plagiosum]|uniref:folylpolyglutamate synthase, mitochondrial isoform X1 n=1 Tax=Chiloscyllium plagiosum TaxID=36176 RepID=UPI001CB7F677|nr:folylpolyglutamate synthase, mitochondrial isoform X1 [Chiloscyllium plagiosum]
MTSLDSHCQEVRGESWRCSHVCLGVMMARLPRAVPAAWLKVHRSLQSGVEGKGAGHGANAGAWWWRRRRSYNTAPTKAALRLPRMEYQDAIMALNTLQTNASTLEQIRREQQLGRTKGTLEAMKSFVHRAGMKIEDFDQLAVIHVTGTKGKGSTCAFCEKILHEYGLKTGFYSSPHLVQVRERIRINGKPISRELFTKYFWQVYNRLDETKDIDSGAMPAYFRFLTILAFHIFLHEKVDLAIIEVGIGGAYDCTNIIRRPVVCGVSSLGIDHVSILGDTMEKIAWQKGGIFKPGVPAFTVSQPSGPMSVLVERAKEIGCFLQLCPDLEDFWSEGERLSLGLAGEHQKSNASLALQLCRTWLQHHNHPDFPPFQQPLNFAERYEMQQPPISSGFCLTTPMINGLRDTKWLGRSQILKRGPVTYYIDGAHTIGSIKACVKWFQEHSLKEAKAVGRGPVVRVLLFNTTGDRDAAALLKLLMPCQFDFAVFCPNLLDMAQNLNASKCGLDQKNYTVSLENMLSRCLDNHRAWCKLTEVKHDNLWNLTGSTLEGSTTFVTRGGLDEEMLLLRGPECEHITTRALVFPCINNGLQWITQGRDSDLQPSLAKPPNVHPAGVAALKEASSIQILITGSLHLVGGCLKLLDQSLSQ